MLCARNRSRCWGYKSEPKQQQILMEDIFPGEKQAKSVSHADDEALKRQIKKGKRLVGNLKGKTELNSKGPRGARAAQWVKRPTLDFRSGHDLKVRGFQPHIGVSAVSIEPALDPPSCSLSASPPYFL